MRSEEFCRISEGIPEKATESDSEQGENELDLCEGLKIEPIWMETSEREGIPSGAVSVSAICGTTMPHNNQPQTSVIFNNMSNAHGSGVSSEISSKFCSTHLSSSRAQTCSYDNDIGTSVHGHTQ